MRRTTAVLLAVFILLSFASCAAGDDTKSSGNEKGKNESELLDSSQDGTKSTHGGEESEEIISNLSYSSVTEAISMTNMGLNELRAYERNATTSGQLTAVTNHYFNKFYLPYLKQLAKEQHIAKKDTVSSEWFKKQNQSMNYLPEDYTYGNIYKKMAQDMYTRMLPDPDVILEQIRTLAENNGFLFNEDYSGQLTKENRTEKLKELKTESEALQYIEYINDWYGDCYFFQNADGSEIALSFICPRYNQFGIINDYFYNWETIPEDAFTVEPRTDAAVTLEELAEARARFEREFYIQDICVTISNEGILSNDRQNELLLELMEILQPYCNTNSERLADILASGTEKNLYKFDQCLEYFKQQVYMKKQITRPDFLNYFVTIQDEARYGFSDSYLDVHAFSNYDAEKKEGRVGVLISCGGNEIVPTYRVKEHGSPEEVMGVYYPLLVPVYYNDAVINGFFEPYRIPECLPEYEITITPDYTTKYYNNENPYVPIDISSENSEEGQSPTYLFMNGFGEASHSLSWHEREKLDLSALGYTKNSDGTWDRSIASRVDGATSTLTYDDTGLLIGGSTLYNDFSYKEIEYKTDENGNAIMSIDKLYDKDGKLIDQAITEYSDEMRTTAHYETTIRDGKQNYVKTDSECRDAQGMLIRRTEYNENGSPNNETIVSSREEMISGTAGDARTKSIRTVTYVTYDENGNVTGNHTVDVPMPEDEEPKHAVQKYLEEHTGIRRD